MRAAGERQPLLGHMARPADDLEAARFARQSSSRFTERQAVSGTRRLLGRGDIVGQSSGAWHVRDKWGKSSAWICCTWMDKAGTIWDRARRELYRTDPFHSFVGAHYRSLSHPFLPRAPPLLPSSSRAPLGLADGPPSGARLSAAAACRAGEPSDVEDHDRRKPAAPQLHADSINHDC